jgi:hypothetical protein
VTFTDYSSASYLVVAKLAPIYQIPNLRLLIPIIVAAFVIENFGLATFVETLIGDFLENTC